LKYFPLISVAVATGMVAVGSAFAADMMPMKAAPPVLVYDWNGA
jgi:hypothetical protein